MSLYKSFNGAHFRPEPRKYYEGKSREYLKKNYDAYVNSEFLENNNRGQFKNPDIFGALYWKLSISLLKLNVRMAPEMSGFLIDSRYLFRHLT